VDFGLTEGTNDKIDITALKPGYHCIGSMAVI
jgi:hypothetical protein